MDAASHAPAPPVVDATRWLAAGSLLGLIVLLLVWELAVSPVHSVLWIGIKTMPLCIPLAGILKRKLYTYRWLSLLVWIYFTEGVVRAWSDPRPSSTFALAEIFLCLVLFAACAYHVRLRLKKPAS
jgi:uncharacterized membrane protein